jgi:hypothetical protein
MYVGFSLVHVGLAGATRNVWMIAAFPVSAGLLHRSILREERVLRTRFGDDYDAYYARVPRYWLRLRPSGNISGHRPPGVVASSWCQSWFAKIWHSP